MSYYLFVDDVRHISEIHWHEYPRDCEWITVRSFDQFVDTIKRKGIPTLVSFDYCLDNNLQCRYNRHDIEDPLTGYDCATWLVDYCELNKRRVPEIVAHTQDDKLKSKIMSAFTLSYRILKIVKRLI